MAVYLMSLFHKSLNVHFKMQYSIDDNWWWYVWYELFNIFNLFSICHLLFWFQMFELKLLSRNLFSVFILQSWVVNYRLWSMINTESFSFIQKYFLTHLLYFLCEKIYLARPLSKILEIPHSNRVAKTLISPAWISTRNGRICVILRGDGGGKEREREREGDYLNVFLSGKYIVTLVQSLVPTTYNIPDN